MNREYIIRMADEAKLIAVMEVFGEEIVRFAALVAEHEREVCAKICDERWSAAECAEAIRARGET